MDKAEAIATLRQNPQASVKLVHRDTTGNWFDSHACWLDADGELVMSHPTEARGTVTAPSDGTYKIA